MNHCKKCNKPIDGNFCPSCGYPATLRKIDGRYIISEIGDVLFVNSRFFYTIKSLVIKPGKTVRHFITEDRSLLVRPITFLVVTSLIYTVINYFFPIEDNTFRINPLTEIQVSGDTVTSLILNWMIENFAYSSILTGLFMALGIKLFFRKEGYSLSEIFIFMCFITGISTLFTSVATILQGITHLNFLKYLSHLIMFYYVWATGQFYGQKKVVSYIKAFGAYFLGALILVALILLIGTAIDMIIGYD